MRLRMRAIVRGFALVATTSGVAAAGTIDDFESSTSPSPWVFYNGAEFPGATGSLTSGAGHVGKGAHLAYDFSGGGAYVAATLTLSTPVTTSGIAFWAKVSPSLRPTLRVVDSTNQTLQYITNVPLESASGGWASYVIALAAPSSYYGGAADGVVHQPITGLSVLAGNAIETGTVGALDFDDVATADSLGVTVDPSAVTLLPPPPNSSDLGSRLGVNIHFTSDDKALDIAKTAGFTKVRMDLGWSGVETSAGVYDFSALDKLVTSLTSRNMQLLLILDYFNPLYPAAGTAGFATTTVPAFAAMSQAAATHFAGKNVIFEIWNEPNLKTFWPPAVNAGEYATLAKAAIAAVHAGNKSALVTTAGISTFDFGFLRGYLNAGGATGADALGVHPYRQLGGESVGADMSWMETIATKALGAPIPIWDTEWGYSSTWFGGDGHAASARATQATRAVRELLSAWAVGFPVAIYYDIRDDGTNAADAENNFGLIQNDYTDKPAVVAVRTLTGFATGRSFVGFMPITLTGVHGMVLDGASDRVVVLWADALGASVDVTTTAKSGTTELGTPLTISAQGTFTLHESDGPVYLAFPKSPTPDAGPINDSGSPGVDASSNDAGTQPGESSGCGCRAAPSRSAPSIAVLALGLALAVRRIRSRRR